jgi:hypothetical protein
MRGHAAGAEDPPQRHGGCEITARRVEVNVGAGRDAAGALQRLEAPRRRGIDLTVQIHLRIAGHLEGQPVTEDVDGEPTRGVLRDAARRRGADSEAQQRAPRRSPQRGSRAGRT